MSVNILMSLTVIPAITATLSVVGSLGIIYNLLHRKDKLETTYHRVMFFMSLASIIFSIATGLTTIPSPRGTTVGYAFGNDATCTAVGFAKLLGYSTMFYNFFLAIHFLLTIRYEMKDRIIRARVEPFMHIISLGWPFATALAGLFLDLYHVENGGCWISPYPEGCVHNDELECVIGENAYIYRWVFIGGFFVIIQLSMPIIIGMVILKVWTREKEMNKKYGHNSQQSRLRRASFGNGNRESDSSNVSQSRLRRLSFGNANRQSDGSNVSEEYLVQRKMFRRTKAIALQGTLYLSTFFLTWLFPFVGAIIETLTGNFPIWCVYGTSIFLPFQGFFSFIIYFRPSVSRIRKKNQEKSFLWALHQAVFHHDLHSAKNRNSTRFSGIQQIHRSSINLNRSRLSGGITRELNNLSLGGGNQQQQCNDRSIDIQTTDEGITNDSQLKQIDEIEDLSNVEVNTSNI